MRREMKTRFSIGDALLCVTLAERLHRDELPIRETARRVQKRLPKVNRDPFARIASSIQPRQQIIRTVNQLTE